MNKDNVQLFWILFVILMHYSPNFHIIYWLCNSSNFRKLHIACVIIVFVALFNYKYIILLYNFNQVKKEKRYN